ncbi:MAG TPA: hypothetical protein VNX65_01690 [Patescibacteria group bacterium]|jgi:hypothetical protein|nr:hypothetical protein [Patescibacteria group bacterium]
MSFFTSLGKFISGQSNPISHQEQVSSPSVVNSGGVQKGDSHTFPVVYIKHTKCHLNNGHMQVYCSIANSSQIEIELHKIHLLGTNRVLGNFLRPGEEHECLIYDGPDANSDHDREVYLDYKTHTGDYFESVHDIKFTYQASDKTYSIDEIHLRLPIRDING